MARYAFEDPMAGAQPRSGGGWKQLFWFAVAFTGLGFAGYVYLIPYQKMQHAVGTRQAELASERAAAEQATAERDKLKTTLESYTSTDKDKAAGESKRRTAADALVLALKTGLEELGATVTADGAKLRVSFPVGKVIDANGMDVSETGQAALKILAGAVKKEDAKVRVVARTSSAPPPKELRSLFHTAGEMRAVRAARVMSALEDAGLPPAQLTIIGESDKPAPRPRGKQGKQGKKAAAAAPPADQLDLQIEPE
jgi:flagellar motor protein MotB